MTTSNSNDSQGPSLVGVCIALIVVVFTSTLLRFWSRWISKEISFWWDDWMVLTTAVTTITYYALLIAWTHVGLGRHDTAVPTFDITPSAILSQVTLMFYDTAASALKASASLLYLRIFGLSRTFRWVNYGVCLVVTVWWILLLVIPFTHCDPPIKLVHPTTKGTCSLKSDPWFLATALINFILDVVILLVPVPMVWKLHLATKKKAQLVGVFVLGYSSAFVGLARFIVVARNPKIISPLTDHDITWNLLLLEYLSLSELALGIVAVCVPAIRLIVLYGVRKYAIGSQGSKQQLFTPGYTRQSDSRNPSLPSKSVERTFGTRSGSEMEAGISMGPWTQGSRGQIERSRSDENSAAVEIPKDRVLLRKDVQVTQQPMPKAPSVPL